jgi:hypothetical protein
VLAAPSGPKALAKLFSRAPLVECARCLWIEGVIPGATVTASIGTRPPVSVSTYRAGAHIDVPNGLREDETVTLSQVACGISGPPVTLPGVLAQEREMWPAPAPAVDEPLRVCQHTLQLRELLPGAQIVVARGPQEERPCFGAMEGSFTFADPLRGDDTVELRHEYPHPCEFVGRTRRLGVETGPPPAPWFPHPVCAGDRSVWVAGAALGATVVLLADGAPLCEARASAAEVPIPLPETGLGSAKTIGVRQALCFGGWSDTSTRQIVSLGPTRPPKIAERLHDCGWAVGVTNVDAGTRLSVRSAAWHGEIGFAVANGDARIDVPVWCPLLQGDTISVHTTRCGHDRAWPGVQVEPAPADLAPPIMDTADDAGGAVVVRGVVSGAVVSVEQVAAEDVAPATAGVLLGTAVATTDKVAVPIPRIASGTFLRARQRLCALASSPSDVVKLANYRTPRYVDDSTRRICQLTGPSDPGGLPHPFDTETIDLYGTDLGVSVEQGGRLWLFFGDSREGHRSARDADPIAWTTTPDLGPEGHDPPDLHWWLNEDGDFQRLVVDGLPELGNFEVPTGAFSYDGSLYLFVANEKMRTSHLARAVGGIPAQTPQLLYDVSTTVDGRDAPCGRWFVHVSPTVVRNAEWPGLPTAVGDGVLAFGTSPLPREQRLSRLVPDRGRAAAAAPKRLAASHGSRPDGPEVAQEKRARNGWDPSRADHAAVRRAATRRVVGRVAACDAALGDDLPVGRLPGRPLAVGAVVRRGLHIRPQRSAPRRR